MVTPTLLAMSYGGVPHKRSIIFCILFSWMTSNNQYSACLGSELSQSTRALQQYNQELYSGCTYVSQASQFAETCVVERENAMTSWDCLASIEAKMATALSTNLTFDQQKTFYCEAIILASDCIGNNAILPCGLEGLDLYTNYFTFVPLVQSCYAALGRSPDVININDGGNQQTGMTGTTTTSQPQTTTLTKAATTKMIPTTTTTLKTTTTVPTTTPTTTKVPTTMKTKTVVPSTTKYLTTVTTTTTATLPSTPKSNFSNQGDATSIGHVVWKCSSQTFSNILYSIFLDDIQCRFRNQYDTCLGSELAQNTQGIRQYNRELYNGCNLATQVAQSAENCVVEREKSMASWNCQAKIDAKMATLSSGNLTFNEQKTLYCEALIVTSDCIGNNAILPCGLEGLVLYTEYFTLVPLVQACYAALGRSPDVTDINDGGNQQTASTASASKTAIIKASTSTTVKTTTSTTTLPTTTTKAIPSTTKTLMETTKIESTTTAPKTTVGTTAPSQETEAVGYTGQTNPPDNVVGPISGSTRLTFGSYSAFLVILYIFVTFTT